MCETRTTLAEIPGLGVVRKCNCGCIHLTVGPVTVRLEAAALDQLSAMLQQAQQKHTKLVIDQQKESAITAWIPTNQLPN